MGTAMMISSYRNKGYFLVERALPDSEVARLIDSLTLLTQEQNRFGVRDLMNRIPAIRVLANSHPMITIAREILGERARPVRSVFFDKIPEANWNVPWHQDTSIALKARHDLDGFGPWSEKQGVVHTEPPEEYLANTLTLRVHLDESNRETGVLRVVPATHRSGRVAAQDLISIVESSGIIECNALPGDILLMNPLLFHSSRKAVTPHHRRIIHIEYSAMELPPPLQWHEC